MVTPAKQTIMRKKYSCILACCTALLLFNCKKNDTVAPPQNVQQVSATPGYGEVDFAWQFPQDSSFQYVSVRYKDSAGSSLEQKFSRYTDTAIISGLQNHAYTFTVKTVTQSGVASAAQTFTVTPFQTAYQLVSGTLSVSPDFGAAVVKWRNITGKTVGIKIQYTDSTGATQLLSASSAAAADSTTVTGLQSVQTAFSITVTDATGHSSDAQVFSATPYAEAQFAKTSWSVVDFDSDEEDGEGPDNGFVKYAIDNNINTYWHTAWENDEPGYPHYITVDMGQQQVVSRIEIFNRQGHKDGMTQIQLLGSTDNTNWNNIGTFPFQQIDAGQFFPVTGAARNMRYFKMIALQGADFYTFVAEFNVFGKQ